MNFKDKLEKELVENEIFAVLFSICVIVMFLLSIIILVVNPHLLLLIPLLLFLYVGYKMIALFFK